MNRIRAYFDRIQGRLAVAFAVGALGMAGIAFLSLTQLGGYTGEIADRVAELGARGNYALNLDAAISDQVSAAQEYLITRRSEPLLAADSLARLARAIHDTYIATPGVGIQVREQLASINDTHAQLAATFAQAQADL